MSAFLSWGGTAPGSFRFDAVLQENHSLDAEITTHPVEQGINIADNVRPNPKVITITGIISQAPVYSLDLSLQTSNPLDLFDPKHDHSVDTPPSSQIVTPPQPPLLLSLNSVFNAGLAYIDGGTFSMQTATPARVTERTSISVLTYQTPGPVDYIAQAYSVLRDLQSTATLLTVFGGGGLGGTPGSYGGGIYYVGSTGQTEAGNSTSMYTNMVLKTIAFDRQQGSGGSAHFTLTLHEIRIVSSSVVAAPKPTIVNQTPAVNKGSQAPVTPPAPKVTVPFAGFKAAQDFFQGAFGHAPGMASIQ
jgi:hypothetical protein